jgi:hypothetical protein
MNRVFPIVTKIKCMKASRKVSTADVAGCCAAAEEPGQMAKDQSTLHPPAPLMDTTLLKGRWLRKYPGVPHCPT